MEGQIQTKSAKSVSPERTRVVDVYKEILESICDSVNSCRGRNQEIRDSLSFVLNDQCDQCENDIGVKGISEDKPTDDLLHRLNHIKTLLNELKSEQNDLIERTRY